MSKPMGSHSEHTVGPLAAYPIPVPVLDTARDALLPDAGSPSGISCRRFVTACLVLLFPRLAVAAHPR